MSKVSKIHFGRALVSLVMSACLPLLGTAEAAAAPAERNISSENLTSEDRLTIEEQKQVEQIADALEALDKSRSPQEAKDIFYEKFGKDEAEEAAGELGLTVDELVSDQRVGSENGERGVETFLTCMKSEVTDDLKSIFDVNAIAVLIGQKNYVEAAAKAVKYLAKQGIKRNAAGLVATLTYYGGKCGWAEYQGG